MKAIYKNVRYEAKEMYGMFIALQLSYSDEEIEVNLGDDDLIVDPTDDEWENASDNISTEIKR